MVLFAQEKLGLDAVGFGLLLGGSAVGGVLGSLVAARVVRVVGPARIAIWTMVGSALGFLVFGLSSDPWLAGAMFGLVGFLTVIFNVVLGSLRQALTPDRLLGRVISAFRLFGYGAVPLGSLLGGILARSFGLRSPFVVAGVVIPVVALACLPAINTRTVAEARAAAGLEPVLGRHELRRRRRYIRSGASTPIRPRVLARTWRVALTSHQRALDRAWSSLRTRHSA
jgi:MFS family permease